MIPRVSIITLGSRGNIQPFIAIALVLQAKYAIRFMSSEDHKDFITGFNIEFVNICPKVLYNKAQVKGFGYQLTYLDASRTNEFNQHVKYVKNEFEENRPNLILVGSLSEYFEYYAKYILLIPTIRVCLSTLHLGNDVRYHYLVQAFLYNTFSYYDKAIGRLNSGVCQRITKEEFILESEEIMNGRNSRHIVVCQPCAFFKILVNVPLVGPCSINSNLEDIHNHCFGGHNAKVKIDEFIREREDVTLHKDKPIYCTWGSAHKFSSNTLMRLIVTLTRSKQSGIILIPNLSNELKNQVYALIHDESVRDHFGYHVLLLAQAPHDYLFPKVKCIVHHGGKSTALAAIRAGVPSVIVSTAMTKNGSTSIERLHQTYICHACGFGEVIGGSPESYEPEKLSGAILRVIRNRKMLRRCEDASRELRRIDGCSTLVKYVDCMMTAKQPNNAPESAKIGARLKQSKDDDSNTTEAESLPDYYRSEDSGHDSEGN